MLCKDCKYYKCDKHGNQLCKLFPIVVDIHNVIECKSYKPSKFRQTVNIIFNVLKKLTPWR